MPTSNEDLKKLTGEVEDLREKVAAENAKREEREQSVVNDVTAAQLRAEKARLEAELSAAKAANTAAAVKGGAAAPLEAAKDDEARAKAQLDAANKAADNSGTDK